MTLSTEVLVNITDKNVKVITLEHLKERQNKINSFFSEKNIPYSFSLEPFVRIVAKNKKYYIETPLIGIEFNLELFKKYAGRDKCWLSELAITAKHCELYTEMIQKNQDFLLIFEDDVKPCIDKNKLADIISEFLKTDGDLLYLQSDCPWGHCPKDFKGATFNPVSENLLDITTFYDTSGLSAYCITQKGAKKMLNFYGTLGMINIIDSCLYTIVRSIDFKIYTHKDYNNLFKLDGRESVHRNEKGFPVLI